MSEMMDNNADDVSKLSARRAPVPSQAQKPFGADDPKQQHAATVRRLTRSLAVGDAQRRWAQQRAEQKRSESDAGVAHRVFNLGASRALGIVDDDVVDVGDVAQDEAGATQSDAGAAGWQSRLEELRAQQRAYDEPYEDVNAAVRNLRDTVVESGKNVADATGDVVEALTELGKSDDDEGFWMRRLQDGTIIWASITLVRIAAPGVLTPAGAFALGFTYSFARELHKQMT